MKKIWIASLAALAALFPAAALAADALPSIDPLASTNGLLQTLIGSGDNATTVQIAILLTLLTLLPSILIMFTGFTRIVIVLGFTRSAMGMQQQPPNQIIVGLALFLTLFVMAPTLDAVYNTAYLPLQNGEINQMEFVDRAKTPIQEFMLRQTQQEELDFFLKTSKIQRADLSTVPFHVVVPAFIVSEIKRAFKIGFMIYIPFIVIDMVVASTLMSMGMMMLPPSMISLPFKILLFILVDGWSLTIGTLITSFR